VLGSHVAADRATACRITRIGRSERHDEHLSCDLGDHQPVRRRDRRIEQRIRRLYVVDVIHTQRRVLEQVRGLVVDLERITVIEEIGVQQLILQRISVLHSNTEGHDGAALAFSGCR
jgi:hypothetical protein